MSPRRSAVAAALLACAFPLPVSAQDAETIAHGEKVFERTCAVCHVKRMERDEVRQRRDLAAPPMNFMITHIRMKTNNAKEAFLNHMVDFTLEPTRAKAKAMPRAIDRFGLMPSIRTVAPDITESDIRAVGEWAWHHYDYDALKKELRRHNRMENRGGRGMGRGDGGGAGRGAGMDQP